MTEDTIKKETEETKMQDTPNDTPASDKGVKEKVENTEEKKTEAPKENTKTFTKKPFNKKPFRRRRPPFKREKPEFEQRIVSFRRVTRVMAGGRRFSFSVAMVIGNKKGVAGFGLGKAQDTALAIEKAFRTAKKNLIKVQLNEDHSVPYDVEGKYKSSKVMIRPVKGKGLAAGGAVRIFLEMLGADETGAKILSRSKNNINNVKATMDALKPFAKKYVYVEKKKFPSRGGPRKGGRRPFDKKNGFRKKTFNSRKPAATNVTTAPSTDTKKTSEKDS